MKKALCLILTLILCLPSLAAFADIEGTVQGDIMLTSTEGEVVTSEQPNTNNEITFSDIVADSLLGEAVYKLVEGKVIEGYLDGTFRPNSGLTRAELCKMINLVFDLDKKAQSLPFKDVSEDDDWYYEYVLVAVEAGYIKGFQDNTFRGDDPVTREQACAIINRVTTAKGANLFDLPFADNITDEVSDWALEDVKKIIANYIMPLEDGGKFRATENITRGELALALETFVIILPEYTVTFNTNGGSEVESITVKEGSKAVKPKDPTKKNNTFKGWYSDEKLKTAYDFESAVTKDLTLYAKWAVATTGGGGGGVYIPPSQDNPDTDNPPDEPATYTVTFKFNNGAEDATQTVTSGGKVTKPANPTKELKKFTGWHTDAACTNLYNFENSVTESFTLYAGWEDDIEAINEQKIADLTIFKEAMEDQLAEGLFEQAGRTTFEQMVGIILPTFEEVIADGKSGTILTNDYINTTYAGNMNELKEIWDDYLFVNDDINEQEIFKENIMIVLTDAQSNGYTMDVSETYVLFRAILGDFMDW